MCELEGKENYKKQIFGMQLYFFLQKWCLSWVLENKLRISSKMSFEYNCIILITTCEPTRIFIKKKTHKFHILSKLCKILCTIMALVVIHG
jgi:hypothetical protein